MVTIKRFALTLLLAAASLMANVFADEQPAAMPNDASVQPQATAPVEVAAPPVQQASQPVQQPSQPVQQAPAEQETVQSSWQSVLSGWVAVALLLVIVVLLIRNGWAAKKSLGSAREEPKDDVPDIKDKKLPFIGNPQLILNDERFVPGTELYSKAQELASHRADCFMKALDKKLGSNAKPEDPIDRNTLQAIANSLQPEFVDEMCKPGTIWMQKVFDNAVPEYLPLYIRNLFKPIQVPEGAKLKLEVPAVAVGIMAALGALIGAWIVGFFAWTGGMKQPGDITTLLGAAIGAGLFSWLIFWATANEAVRKTLEIAVGTVAAVDSILTITSSFISISSFFGVKKTIQGGFLKRVFLYAACWFVLHLMKRPLVFDRVDYKHKLETLYFERIQSIVLLLSSCSVISENDRKTLNEVQEEWAKKVEERDAEIKRLELIRKNINSMVPRVCSLWDSDIRNLEVRLRSLAQDYTSLGFNQIPMSKRMRFAEQLETIPNLDEILGDIPPKERPTFIWSDENKEQYNCIGLIDPGEKVVVLDDPVIQNGVVTKKGNVQSADDYTEL
ncbi:MAG: hypothetical protein IJF84_02930 [Thermoguttaceae bacterium]|nr:hypothetical protein [Thermoguttaceae bacterium]